MGKVSISKTLSLLKIENLYVRVGEQSVLNGVNLDLRPGQVHAIMGPNGSGKSTLAKVIAGHPDYHVSGGRIIFESHAHMKNLLELSPDQRAREGIFLGFQYPVEIPGVTNLAFLQLAFNTVCKHHGVAPLSDSEFLQLVAKKCDLLDLPHSFLDRPVNEGFSGGEKKKNEILQMAVLSPRIAILDETDSGLDIDALKTVSQGINKLRAPDKVMLLITHYQRLLDYIEPDFVHVLVGGKIVESGDHHLARQLEVKGYEGFSL